MRSNMLPIAGAASFLSLLVFCIIYLLYLYRKPSDKLDTRNAEKVLKGVAVVGGVTLTAVALKSLYAKGFSFLEDYDWNFLDPKVQDSILTVSKEMDSLSSLAERVAIAESHYNNGLYITSSMWIFTTLEAGLREIVQDNGLYNSDVKDDLGGLTHLLKPARILDKNEIDYILDSVRQFRNDVAHGKFHRFELQKNTLPEVISFTKKLLQKYKVT